MRQGETYLLDMLIAAQNIQDFLSDLTADDFYSSRLHQSATVRELQVIGEAARQITDETKATHPEIEWGKISGMRNRIIHEYFRIDFETVWKITQEDIEPLIEHLKNIVPPDPDTESK